MKSHRQQFLNAFEQEMDRTARVLQAYPDDQSGFRPQELCRTDREVAWPLATGLDRLILKGLEQGASFGRTPAPGGPPPPPERVSQIAAAVAQAREKIVAQLAQMDDSDMDVSVQFFVAPKTMGDVPMTDFLWSVLFDHIHHRGQLSIYLKIVGTVPSIYGPSAAQPWR